MKPDEEVPWHFATDYTDDTDYAGCCDCSLTFLGVSEEKKEEV